MILNEVREKERPETKSEGPWPCLGPARSYFTVKYKETSLEKWYEKKQRAQQEAGADMWPGDLNWNFDFENRTAQLDVQQHTTEQKSESSKQTKVHEPDVRKIGQKERRDAAERKTGLAEKQLKKAKTADGKEKKLIVVSSSDCNVRNAYWTDKW